MIDLFGPVSWPTVVVSVAIAVFAGEVIRASAKAVWTRLRARRPQA